MNVASLELCRELYEVSGWGDYPERTHFTWRQFEGKTTGSLYYSYAENYSAGRQDPFDGRRPTGITHRINAIAPAYDLGFLLRKLPPVIHEDKKFLALEINAQGDGTWDFAYTEPYDKEFLGWHITKTTIPEDAAAKLAIELFKQGLLSKEPHE